VELGGWVEERYTPVWDAVRRCGPGVAVAALVDGRVVADVWTADLGERSLLCTWSAIKPVTAACLLLLVERGAVGLDDPVVSVWPELGDDRLLLRHLLTHTAGRVSVPDVSLADWEESVAALAAFEPDWPPGEVICEHAKTFGHLVGEVVRRIDGRSLGRFLADEFTGPLGLDLMIGVPANDLDRVADTVGMDQAWWEARRGTRGSVAWRARGPWIDVNDRDFRQSEIPAVNGHATARGLAGFWQAYLDGRLPVEMGHPGVTGHDRLVGEEVTWTLGSARLEGADVGMGGAGGQWAAARPSSRLAWAFLTSHAGGHQRAQTVEDAIVASLPDPYPPAHGSR
jgi:CubicO group peptidase (beta-lactamase class C family)